MRVTEFVLRPMVAMRRRAHRPAAYVPNSGAAGMRPVDHELRPAACFEKRLNVLRALSLAVLILVAWLVSGKTVAAGALRNMDEVGAAIRACWNAPAGLQHPFVTLSFSFRRDGTLIGPPQLTAIRVSGDAATRQTLANAAITALERCAPLPLAPVLGDSIAGQVFTMQFFAPDSR